MASPDYAEVSRLEEELLTRRLQAVRSAISHPGEKGRAVEDAVTTLLRDILPPEYGLSSGFIVGRTDDGTIELSPQLDIIIFDAIRSGPLTRLSSVNVFPLEAVYGYVEVKTTLRTSDAADPPHDSIEACAVQNKRVRQMRQRRYYAPPDVQERTTKAKEYVLAPIKWLGIRSFLVGFELQGGAGDTDHFARRMGAAMKRAGYPAHFHGVFVPQGAMLRTVAVNKTIAAPADWWHVQVTNDRPLVAFRTQLLHSLATFPRPGDGWIADLEQYFGGETPPYREVAPPPDESIAVPEPKV